MSEEKKQPLGKSGFIMMPAVEVAPGEYQMTGEKFFLPYDEGPGFVRGLAEKFDLVVTEKGV